MQASDFLLSSQDGTAIFVRGFVGKTKPRAVVQISHGMAEHSGRYRRLAELLTDAGYAVYASDHRGHGHTAREETELGHFADQHGWRSVVDDLALVMQSVKQKHEGLPFFLLGHSMGSLLARSLAVEHGAGMAGLVVSGSAFPDEIKRRVLRQVVRLERLRLGKRGKSAILKKLSFGTFNDAFAPNRTDFDWLNREPVEVDRYIDDPFCGFEVTTQLWFDLIGGLGYIGRPQNIARYPKTLPVLIMAGEDDPSIDRMDGVRKLERALTVAKLESVTTRTYPGARHEIFHERNRDEVSADLLRWLDTQLG